MKNQALFSSKDKSKKLKCRLLQFFVTLFGLKRFKSYTDLEIRFRNKAQSRLVKDHHLD